MDDRPELNTQSAWVGPACLLLAWIWWSWLGQAYAEVLRPASGRVVDLYQDWASARNQAVGLPVYAAHEQSVPRHLGHAWTASLVRVNAHPPTSVFLFLPLAALDYRDAVLVWNLVSLAALAGVFGLVLRELGADRRLWLPGGLILAFGHPVYAGVYLGQSAMVLGALLVGAWALDRRGQALAAGGLIGVAAAFKLYPAFVLIVYLARGQWRPIAAAGATFALLALGAAVAFGPDVFADYFRDVVPAQRVFWGVVFNLSLTGFWHRLFEPTGDAGRIEPLWFSPTAARLATLAGGLLVAGLVGWLARQARTVRGRDAAWSAAILGMLLVAPVTWEDGLIQAALPLGWVASVAWNQPVARSVLVGAFLILWLPPEPLLRLVTPAWGGAGRPYGPAFSLVVASLKTYALLAVFGLVGWSARNRPGTPARFCS
ncbi:MAG: hypothetical protein KatS3mg108_0425 [Isosphaeraceae bacterium]|jgi:alpha-1,2-mannosyltransferase|nr:MAG: hypothetical protein KatS3mg108_0425 [Isosphaeraceae bacterium]